MVNPFSIPIPGTQLTVAFFFTGNIPPDRGGIVAVWYDAAPFSSGSWEKYGNPYR
jgi:hypothetical protein